MGENCLLLGYYAVSSGNSLPHLSVPIVGKELPLIAA